jgi:Fic family protein
VHQVLQRTPITTIPRLAKKTRLTLPTIAKALDVLVELSIAREITGKQRHRIYSYDRYMSLLSEGTEPL